MNLMEALLSAKLVGSGGGGGGGAVSSVNGKTGAVVLTAADLDDSFKAALLACFAHVAWTDEHGQDYYDALEAALYPPADLVSISAVYTQSGTVYDTDSLDSLRADLVVTATYSNGNVQTVTDYVLSGTLAEGTSTITVSYGGKTATFEVTVTGIVPLWEAIDESFTGGALLTLQPICNADRDFTVAIDITLNTNPKSGDGSEYRLPRIIDNKQTSYALAVYKPSASATQLNFLYMGRSAPHFGKSDAGRHRFVITHTAGSGVATIQYRYENETIETRSVAKAHTDATADVVIGYTTGKYQLPPGTLNHGLIYGIVWEQSEINAFLGVTEGGE